MQSEHSKLSGSFSAGLMSNKEMPAKVGMDGFFTITCVDKDGNLKWEEKIENRVVNEGLSYMLESGLGGGTQITSWFIGLTDGTPTDAAGDTLASHAGWAEVTAYAGDRKACSFGAESGQSIDNSASPAAFAIDTNSTTIGGAFLASVATGTSGTLFSVGAFSGGDKSADDGDTLNVTYTATSQDV